DRFPTDITQSFDEFKQSFCIIKLAETIRAVDGHPRFNFTDLGYFLGYLLPFHVTSTRSRSLCQLQLKRLALFVVTFFLTRFPRALPFDWPHSDRTGTDSHGQVDIPFVMVRGKTPCTGGHPCPPRHTQAFG